MPSTLTKFEALQVFISKEQRLLQENRLKKKRPRLMSAKTNKKLKPQPNKRKRVLKKNPPLKKSKNWKGKSKNAKTLIENARLNGML